ncbi:MAG: hypothetical protein IJH37_13115 [Clostridia bacterium]|nr:hypothetical protein [Clostridia bacterium]
MMKVIVKGTIDIESIPAATISTYASYVLDEAKKFFGDPANNAEFEAWRRERMCVNGRI